MDRRNFVQKLAAALGSIMARFLGLAPFSKVFTATGAAAATGVVASAACGAYGSGVRQQVFEVIVRQAMAGAPWKEICAGPMQVNGISEGEVEAELKRRKERGHPPLCPCEFCGKRVGRRFCGCETCSGRRAKKETQFQERLRSIQHSAVAPCACYGCREAVLNTIRNIRIEVFGDEA